MTRSIRVLFIVIFLVFTSTVATAQKKKMLGTVLIAGGLGSSGVLSSAELYDVAAGTFSPTGDMTAARYGHAASPLSDGKVLITGGNSPSGLLSSAELYDPSNGLFSATNSPMTTDRNVHTATLLQSGKVLIAGGQSGCCGGEVAVSSAELYEPLPRTFTSTTTPMTQSRFQHTATRLLDGTVLIVGGFVSPGSYASLAELYDPNSDSFSPAGNLATARANHVAVLLSNGDVLIAGGDNGSTALSSAEVYHPGTGFSPTVQPMGTARSRPVATILPSGQVLIAGGDNLPAGTESYSSAELYDPTSRTFSPTIETMAIARVLGTATLLVNNKVLVAGGNLGRPSAELYNQSRFKPTIEMNTPRQVHTATPIP